MLRALAAGVMALAMLAGQPASAEVVESAEGGFVTRDMAIVEAAPKEVWLELIAPKNWWNSGHTWSGDAANLTLKPQAGGCFCERIPEDPDLSRITLEGSVEHMRVIQAYPEHALRMKGALGPLQSEPVSGVLTVAISQVEKGTRIVWEYIVGGYMRYEPAMIAKAVDGVMSEQLKSLSMRLGPIEAQPSGDVQPDGGQEGEADGPSDDASEGRPDASPDESLSVEDALDQMARDKRED